MQERDNKRKASTHQPTFHAPLEFRGDPRVFLSFFLLFFRRRRRFFSAFRRQDFAAFRVAGNQRGRLLMLLRLLLLLPLLSLNFRTYKILLEPFTFAFQRHFGRTKSRIGTIARVTNGSTGVTARHQLGTSASAGLRRFDL